MSTSPPSRRNPDPPRVAVERAVEPRHTRSVAYRYALLGILLLAGVWRLAIALSMPCLSRDGVTFCWYARDLGEQGAAFLRAESTHQHPLFPLAILGTHAAARTLGAADTPWTWQRSGQVVAWLAGMAVVALSAVLTVRLVRLLKLPIDARLAGLLAAILAALLPLNVRLSADVMSDQVLLAFYLAAVLALLRIETWTGSLLCGVFAGLAFLTRPEGAGVLIGGLAAAVALARSAGWRTSLARVSIVVVGFLLLAAPLWGVTGRLSPKKNPLEILSGEETAATYSVPRGVVSAAEAWPSSGSPGVYMARLQRHDFGWHMVPLWVAYTLFRAGRVVVPLLALAPLIHLRKRLLGRELIGVSTSFAIHALLAMALLYRWKYLAPRHTLVLVAVLLPLAAMLLSHVRELTRANRQRWLWPVVVAVCLLPLCAYSLRIPNGETAFLRRTASWLTSNRQDLRAKLLTGGSSQRRIAFYANMRWKYWLEDPGDLERIRGEMLYSRPDYFAIETGRGFERERNAELLEQLRREPRLGPVMQEVHAEPAARGGRLLLYELRWPGN